MENLEEMKKEYLSASPPPEGKERMKETIARAKAENRQKRQKRRWKAWGSGLAAAAAIIVLLPNISSSAAYAMSSVPVLGQIIEAVTFREYAAESEDGRFEADVEIPQLRAADGLPVDAAQLQQINAEIREIAQEMIDEFETNMAAEASYEQLVIKYEILDTADDYFSLKLITYCGAGSGYEKDYYYALDLNSGKQLTLADLFPADADYITPISENIKEQMRSRMEEDKNKIYWVDADDGIGWTFEAIPPEQSFYVNRDGHLVITFSEGDVAPMYMGCDEFVIPDTVTENIK